MRLPAPRHGDPESLCLHTRSKQDLLTGTVSGRPAGPTVDEAGRREVEAYE